jgi:hypothetical protein
LSMLVDRGILLLETIFSAAQKDAGIRALERKRGTAIPPVPPGNGGKQPNAPVPRIPPGEKTLGPETPGSVLRSDASYHRPLPLQSTPVFSMVGPTQIKPVKFQCFRT